VTEEIPEMNRLIDWLPTHMPAGALDDKRVAIVHGDYRIDNLIFHPQRARALAVLDWELSTLGHPLADFSYHCMAWHIPPGMFRGVGGLDLQALGIPSERETIERYCERTQLASPDELRADWNFYLAYNLFRLAAITQGIARRVVDGTAASLQAKTTGAATRGLAELGWSFACKG
jgi:aminoglycoside phosphotransferase (APT) family kinase protein